MRRSGLHCGMRARRRNSKKRRGRPRRRAKIASSALKSSKTTGTAISASSREATRRLRRRRRTQSWRRRTRRWRRRRRRGRRRRRCWRSWIGRRGVRVRRQLRRRRQRRRRTYPRVGRDTVPTLRMMFGMKIQSAKLVNLATLIIQTCPLTGLNSRTPRRARYGSLTRTPRRRNGRGRKQVESGVAFVVAKSHQFPTCKYPSRQVSRPLRPQEAVVAKRVSFR